MLDVTGNNELTRPLIIDHMCRNDMNFRVRPSGRIEVEVVTIEYVNGYAVTAPEWVDISLFSTFEQFLEGVK